MSLLLCESLPLHVDRRKLFQEALHASMKVRTKAGFDFKSPCNLDGLCNAHNVAVRFCDIASMEGMYERASKPLIIVSALRPLARRVFTCIHELGHHIFGHGSTIDELRENISKSLTRPPEEILVDAFASFVLMPTLGIREAFAKRSLDPEKASPSDIFAIACNFGVGQATLVNHMRYTLNMLSQERRDFLGKITPKKIRVQLLGQSVAAPLIYVDHQWNSPTLDAEVGTYLLLPQRVVADTSILHFIAKLENGCLFRAEKPGVTRIAFPDTSSATTVRVAKFQYVGLARYRYLEDE